MDGVNDAVKKAVDSVTEFKDEALAITHVALDTGGLFPVFGAIPDALNAVIYIAEGDYKNAGLSLFSALPIVGYAGTGIKYGSKILQARKATQTVQEARRVTNVYSPGSLRLDLQFFGKGTGNPVHGNSKNSTKPQHGYEISEKETGDVVKTGISGQSLNKNGTSPRANSQVNKMNREARYDKYGADVVNPNLSNRQEALDWERDNAQRLWEEGNSMNKHQRPKPWEE